LSAVKMRVLLGVFSLMVLVVLCLLNVRENHWVTRPEEPSGVVPITVLLKYPEKYEGRLVLVSGTVTGFFPASSLMTLENAYSEVRILLQKGSGLNVGDDVTVYGRVMLASKGYVEAV